MGRPKIDYTGQLVGTLKVGERIFSAKHARFAFTCMVCSTAGEADARYLVHGCKVCKVHTLPEKNYDNVLVVTGAESYWVTTLQLVKAAREHPLAQFYYQGRRTIVTETDDDVCMSQPAIDGVERGLVFSKYKQELGYHSIGKPEATYEPPTLITPAALIAATPHQTDKPLKLRTEDLLHVPPEGGFLLQSVSDGVFLTDTPTEMPVPQYLVTWCESFPRGTTFRPFFTNGMCYGMFTLPPPVPKDDNFDDEPDTVQPPRLTIVPRDQDPLYME